MFCNTTPQTQMTSSPFRFSVTPDDLAQHPTSSALANELRPAAIVPGSEFRNASSLGDGTCRDIHGDLPYGMFVVKHCSLRGHAGIIFTSTGTPLLEQNAGLLTNDGFLKALANTSACPPNVNTPTTAHLLSLVSTCTDCFWHWMMDSLPKAFLAEQSGYTGAYLLPAHIPETIGFDSMALLGVSRPRLIVHNNAEHTASNLYIPTYFSGFNAHLNAPFMRAFRSHILSRLPAESSSENRIYVARKPEAKHRRVANHPAVETALHQHGFKTVYFEDLSLNEQISTAANATIMIAPHGSGMTHSLFMKDRSSIIELFPYKRQASCDCYEKIAVIPQHHYRSLESTRDCGSDIEVDIGSLTAILQNVPT
jgi:hypothetical protein